MESKEFARQGPATLRFNINLTGMTGSSATYISMYKKIPKKPMERETDMMTRGCVQGRAEQAELRPKRKRTRSRANEIEPRKSMRLRRALADRIFLAGSWTNRMDAMTNQMASSVITRNGLRQPNRSFNKPPSSPPKPWPRPKRRFPNPCQRPRSRSENKSLHTKLPIAFIPPPPIPAKTRPKIITDGLSASPQQRLPTAKMMPATTRPAR